MLRSSALLFIAIAAAGCDNNQTLQFDGDDMAKYFPLTGSRTWTFKADDSTTPYLIVGQTAEESELLEDGRTRVYTVDFTYECFSAAAPCLEDLDEDDVPDLNGTTAFSWQLSANSTTGVNLHGFADRIYDPAVRLADPRMVKGETVESESGGTTFTSTFESQGLCPAPYWRNEPPEDCIHLVVEDGGAGNPIVGEIWAIYQFNIVAFTLAHDGVAWQLQDYDDEL
jgi:hypothetical protein